MGKFSSRVGELLHAMSVEGWANATSGDVECAAGWFALISNEEADLLEIRGAFPGFEDVTNESLVGHFVCVENNEGFWDTQRFATKAMAKEEYDRLDGIYTQWVLS